ncbi:MAG: S-adenosylhomocysteine deaminase, partial [Sulfobacillus thermosulfidooxidans]
IASSTTRSRTVGTPSGLCLWVPGRPADLIVVDATAAAMTPEIDPVANVVYTATGSNVLYTVVNGEILLADGLLTRLDERAIIQEAKQRLQHLFA